jgi:hypothetical protein
LQGAQTTINSKWQQKKWRRCSGSGNGNSNGDGNGDGDSDKNGANADNEASTIATTTMHPGSALWQNTALSPWPPPSRCHRRCRRAEILAAIRTMTMATVAAATSMMRTTAGEIEGMIGLGLLVDLKETCKVLQKRMLS